MVLSGGNGLKEISGLRKRSMLLIGGWGRFIGSLGGEQRSGIEMGFWRKGRGGLRQFMRGVKRDGRDLDLNLRLNE